MGSGHVVVKRSVSDSTREERGQMLKPTAWTGIVSDSDRGVSPPKTLPDKVKRVILYNELLSTRTVDTIIMII